jgi:hypothetical protein
VRNVREHRQQSLSSTADTSILMGSRPKKLYYNNSSLYTTFSVCGPSPSSNNNLVSARQRTRDRAVYSCPCANTGERRSIVQREANRTVESASVCHPQRKLQPLHGPTRVCW